MARLQFSLVFLMIAAAAAAIVHTDAQLTPHFYDYSCPGALFTIRKVVAQAIQREPRMGASLLRLHFHDCFVDGCDGSILLDDTSTFKGEKTARPNVNSVRGFDVIDQIKSAVNAACHGNVVSCADILAVAARDSVNILGGRYYPVYLGRKDSRTASLNNANNNIPSPFLNLQGLLTNFQNHNLNLKDLVVLSGGHTLGLARCSVYQSRIDNDTNIDPQFRAALQKNCPNPAAQNNNTNPLDFTPARFDTVYFRSLLQFKGLLHSDQELYKKDGSEADNLVTFYSNNPEQFWYDFGVSMIKMGDLKNPNPQNQEIRLNCRSVNN